MLATLCLNEMEWLPRLYEQHKDWPELRAWVFVESADQAYADANPDMVTSHGTSIDGTHEFLEHLSNKDCKVIHSIKGFSGGPSKEAGKCWARQTYLSLAELLQPEFVIVLDADEFYTREHQAWLLRVMRKKPEYSSFIFQRRELWRPPSIVEEPLMSLEVVGGFWGIPCCHWWRWQSGMNHFHCHNTPYTKDGVPMNKEICDMRGKAGPQMVHMGFASQRVTRLAKNKYYEERGEAQDKLRRWYTFSRAAWKHWRPGVELPHDAKVIKYDGPVPEVFDAEKPSR